MKEFVKLFSEYYDFSINISQESNKESKNSIEFKDKNSIKIEDKINIINNNINNKSNKRNKKQNLTYDLENIKKIIIIIH